MKITMESVAYNIEPKNANFSGIIWKRNGRSYLNASAEIYEDLDKMILTFIFAISKDKNDKNYENVVMRTSLSSCKINDGNRGNFLIKMAMEGFEKTADFKFTCPFLKVSVINHQRVKVVASNFNHSRNRSTSRTLSQTRNICPHFCSPIKSNFH